MSDFRKSRAYRALYHSSIKRRLERIPFVRRIYAGWGRTHPIDVYYGIDTSGFVPAEAIHPDQSLTKKIIPYAGSQPGIVRTALSTIPNPGEYTFVDIGCGKGRVTIVASEFGFRKIIGVELSSDLVRVARANAEKVTRQYPDRPPIEIVEGDATRFPFPGGKVVVFMYHPFGRELMSQLRSTLESHIASSIEHIFIVYQNPVHGELFDAVPALTRWFAQTVPYDESEVGFGPDLEETVVIWQSAQRAHQSPHAGRERRIIVTKESWTAALAD